MRAGLSTFNTISALKIRCNESPILLVLCHSDTYFFHFLSCVMATQISFTSCPMSQPHRLLPLPALCHGDTDIFHFMTSCLVS